MLKICIAAAASMLLANASANNYINVLPPAEEQALQNLSAKTNVPYALLKDAAQRAEIQNKIIKTMNKPWEAKPWYIYKNNFLTSERAAGGARFWSNNSTAFNRAYTEYGVPPEIVASIIGVETFYGKNMGSYLVLDALYTLGFHYPQRAAYFQGEFANFVVLARKQGWRYEDIRGSYAGAMGLGQFMPTSYLKWAVDFDKDGHTNIMQDPTDAIGSVANYFYEHGWIPGGETTIQVNVTNTNVASSLVTKEMKLNTTVGNLRKAGVIIPFRYNDNIPVKLLRFDEKDGYSWHLAFNNFIVITTYNKSPLYAMSVYLLSQNIKSLHNADSTRKPIPMRKY